MTHPVDLGSDFPFVQSSFDDCSWQAVNLPHDRAIEGPFNQGQGGVGGGMGRLPSPGGDTYRNVWLVKTDSGHVGQVTPAHVLTSGNEAELCLNGTSLGRRTKGEYEYHLRSTE